MLLNINVGNVKVATEAVEFGHTRNTVQMPLLYFVARFSYHLSHMTYCTHHPRMSVCLYVCVYACIGTHCVYVLMCPCVCGSVYVSICIHLCTNCVNIIAPPSLSLSIYIYIMYIYIYIFVYMYIYIYRERESESNSMICLL